MSTPGKAPDLQNLTENLTQQQAKISALKEFVRQSEYQKNINNASAQEKVKNIAQRLSNSLSNLKSKSRHRSNLDISDEHSISNIEEEPTNPEASSSQQRNDTSGSEKILLLRKQMELNRAKMAERESKSRDIEQMVSQLKSKFETSQLSLEKSIELGMSMGDLSTISSVPLHSQSFSDVSHDTRGFNFDNERILFLERRIRELKEALTKKENETESEKVQKLEGKILDLEENLKEKESVIEARTKAISLLTENLTKKKKDVVDSLEDTKQEMIKMQETFVEAETSYNDEVERLNRVISEQTLEMNNLREKIVILDKSLYQLTIENSELKTKLESVPDYTKISELNKLNETLQKQILNLESQRYEFINECESSEAKSEGNDNTLSELLEKINTLEKQLESHNTENEELKEKLQEKTVELNVINANFRVLQDNYNSMEPKSLFQPDSNNELLVENTKLKQQLDDSNKNMIKAKLKIKHLQKQIESLKKEDTHPTIAHQPEEIESSQCQEERAENAAELNKKIKELETTCHNQTLVIERLEEQKNRLIEDLDVVKTNLTANDNSEFKAKFFKIDKINKELDEKYQQLVNEKAVLQEKLSSYVSENIELHNRIEKLSKGSSAESIEMVHLTAQENEEYQKALVGHKSGDDTETEISQELNDSLRSLREESSELMSKIELFTIERREVLHKLDIVTNENQILLSSIGSVKDEKVALELENESLKENLERIEKKLSEVQKDKEEISKNLKELNENRLIMHEEINRLLRALQIRDESSERNETPIDKHACEKILKQLDSEIQNFNKSKEKTQKLKISKKLCETANNVNVMMTNVMSDYQKDFDERKQLLESLQYLLEIVSKNYEAKVQECSSENRKNSLQSEDEMVQLEKLSEDNDSIEILKLEKRVLETFDELKSKEELVTTLQHTIDALNEERNQFLIEAQNQVSIENSLRAEIEQLSSEFEMNQQRLFEKSSELEKFQRETEMRLKTSENEVEILKTLVSEQKQLLIDSYQEHEVDVNQRSKEINEYQNRIKQMEDELNTLKELNASKQETCDEHLNEIKFLKNLLNENNRMLDTLKEELLLKQETVDTLNSQIIDLYKTIEGNALKIIEKEEELQLLQEKDEISRNEIHSLNSKLLNTNNTIKELTDKLSEKEHELELKQNSSVAEKIDSEASILVEKLEKEIKEVNNKNKDQHDKIKKLVANLRKKQTHCAELEEKLAKLEGENCELRNSIQKSSEAIFESNSSLNAENIKKADEFEGFKQVETEDILRKQISGLEASNRLPNDDDVDKQRSVSLENQLETLEVMNGQLRFKVDFLNESIAVLESEKVHLNREKLSFETQIEEKDALIRETSHEYDAQIFQLSERVKELLLEKELIQQKLLENEIQWSSNETKNIERISSLENDNSHLRQQAEELQNSFKQLSSKHSEMESELSFQICKIESEKKTSQEALEKANRQIVDFQDEIVRMKDNLHSLDQSRADLEQELSWLKIQNENYTQDQLENEQLRTQLIQSATEAENLRSQNANLLENHNAEIMVLRQQVLDLEAMRSQVSQNQTDDQVLLHNENTKLKKLLEEKENEIQRNTIQLQMVSTVERSGHAVIDPFANLTSEPFETTSSNDHEEVNSLKAKLALAEGELVKLREALVEMEVEIQNSKAHENKKMKKEIEELKSKLELAGENASKKFLGLEDQLFEKNKLIEQLQKNTSDVIPKEEPQNPGTSTLFSEEDSQDFMSDDPFNQQQEVVEEFIQPKKAYLCYNKTSSVGTQTNETGENLEEKEAQLEQLQYQVQMSLMDRFDEFEQQKQILNETVLKVNLSHTTQGLVPSAVDQCHPSEVFDIEGGSCWGDFENSEVQQSSENQSLIPSLSDSKARSQEHMNIIEHLEQEKKSLHEELTNLRESSKKMMKKLREYQIKIKDLEQKANEKISSVDTNDMDLLIQEELKYQASKLEARIKDLSADNEKLQQEKDSILKRVDVLTAANERLIEAKELQDNQTGLLKLQIQDLNRKLLNLQEWDTEEDKKPQQTNQEFPTSDENQGELEKKIKDLNDLNKDMQVDYDKIQDLLDEEKLKNKILEEKISSLTAIQTAKEEEMKMLLDQQIYSKDMEIRDMISKIDFLSNESTNIKTVLNDLSTQVQLKTNENEKLNERLQNLAVSNDQLSHERQLYNDSIEKNFRQYSHDLEQQLQTVMAELQYKNSQIHQMNDKISELSFALTEKKSISDDLILKEEEIKSLRASLHEIENNQQISQEHDIEEVLKLKQEIGDLRHQRSQMEHELQVLNDQVLANLDLEEKMNNTLLELDAKNIEIQMLKTSLEKISQTQNDPESSVYEKKIQQEDEANRKSVQEESKTKMSTDVIEKMSSIMESQELEIVSLKEQLAVRSAEYAFLSSKVDPYHQLSSSMSVSPVQTTDIDKVPRSELDLALYMLHQRDMRLEELTMELVRLLDERDELQLRLSNSIRQIEQGKNKQNEPIEAESSKTAIENSERWSSTNESFMKDEHLQAKLSEMSTVRQAKDKAIQDEREKRFRENMALLQRDKDVHIPPEEPTRVEARPSDQGLMNWLLGKNSGSS